MRRARASVTRAAWSAFSRLPVAPEAAWGLRRGFWNGLTTVKFSGNEAGTVPVPTDTGRPVLPVPLASAFPSIPIRGIAVGDHVPADEAMPLKRIFTQFQAALGRVWPPAQPGLAPIAPDPNEALSRAYTYGHRRRFPLPARPAELAGGVDLAGLAVAGPYTCYLQAAGEDTFRWDLSSLDGFECHRGLRPPGVVVDFRIVPGGDRLEAVAVDSDLGRCGPDEPGWDAATRLALCGAGTHLSLVRHFNWVHLIGGARLAMATRNHLPAAHPVRRLLWPHVYGTQASNQVVTPPQLAPGGDFETVFSYTHRGLCSLLEATAGGFDLRLVDPAADARLRGVADTGLGTPSLRNRLDLMGVIQAHVSRYLGLYFADDGALAADEPFGAWLDDIGHSLGPGTGALAGEGVTLPGATRLLSALIYLVTVEHEIVGSGLWHYQLWSDVHPVRVYRDGSRPPLDVYQRLVNADFILNVGRTPLMSDCSHLALDPAGAAAFIRFLADLGTLQRDLDGRPAACWRIEPKMLKANINA